MHLASGLDPCALAERTGLEPQGWQIDALRSDARRAMWLCCRQSGKSSIAALLALHQAVYEPKSLVLVLAPSERQSRETFLKVATAYKGLGRPVASEVENKLSLELENGSRVIALPGSGSTIRGFSAVNLMVVDEAALVSDEAWQAAAPMVAASRGRTILLSTPAGKRGFFWELWNEGRDWERVKVTAAEVPHLDPAAVEELRRELGSFMASQEIDCEFVDSALQVFGSEHIEALFSEEVEAWSF